jgi:uncharacterized protein (TIGR00645 family)
MNRFVRYLEAFIFWSRWLQAPLYVGLIFAQGLYVYKFGVELVHLVTRTDSLSDAEVMLTVVGLIDVVMVANLLIMVIIGGYETFVSRLEDHPDLPEWLAHVNAGVLKIKLGTALISISAIHLLQAFINIEHMSDKALMWQVIIHLTFVLSALVMAYTDRIMTGTTIVRELPPRRGTASPLL